MLLCFSCSNTNSSAESAGGAGHDAGRGGESGADATASGGANGGETAGLSGAAEKSAGDANDAGTSSAGGDDAAAGYAPNGGSGGTGDSGGSGGQAMAGAAIGGALGRDACVWDPDATDHCPVCDAQDGCPQPGYKYVGSGAVTSSCCGLEWQEQAPDGTYSWAQANDYCAGVSLLGGGWRLPTIAELYSLVDLSDESHTLPTIDVAAFADTLREAYWSSSLAAQSGQAAWSVDFSNGVAQSSDPAHPLRVRCVR